MRKDFDNLRLVEIELFSYCNRTCAFCTNSFIDRLSFNEVLDIQIFKKIIKELKLVDYSNYISFSRYNEPLSHRNILDERIKYIRKELPNSKLVLNTNGDYDWEGLDINELTIMDYDNNLSNKELKIIERKDKPKLVRMMRLGEINNRAGSLDIKKKYIRDFPCYEPNYFIGIDYTGDVVPCCNIRSDINNHKPYVLGNVKDNTLEDIFNSEFAVKFRSDVNNLNFPNVCKSCSKEPGRYTSEHPSIMNGVS